MNRNIIEVGDIVRLKQPYKIDDYRRNNAFLQALDRNLDVRDYTSKSEVYDAWLGFTHGIVHQILSRKIDRTLHKLALYLYYPQENGVWLFYGLGRGIPVCVDFSAEEVELKFKSSAPDYGSGEVKVG